MLLSRVSLLILVAPILTMAAEPPVKDGLVVWLNASAQPEARRAESVPALPNLRGTDMALDASGKGRHALQHALERRPIFTTDGEVAYWQFDGKDDFLFVAGPRQLAPAVTVFVLAAPKSNRGEFSGMFATTEAGKNDYTSGLNYDFGPAATDRLSVLNVESAGATGFQNLIMPGISNATSRPFGDFHVFTARSRIAKGGTEAFLDGMKAGARDRRESNVGLDQMVIGGRLYSNDPNQLPFASGTFDGAIAEVLVYDRALNDDERGKVEQALLDKATALNGLLHGSKGHPLEAVKDPPVVQMLVPGFTVRELPVEVGNLTNLRYRHDGKLVGLGYDGRVHLLSDTNGDGLEDKDELFWDQTNMRGPIGIVLLSKDDARGEGVLVASKGKISLILDKDRDGKAEEERVVATGWKESFHNVDTVGLAQDPKDGSFYFGLGTQNFADPYVIDKNTGKALFDIQGTHGTIQKLSADFSKRETIATGVRFTCALALNAAGDLFATEQEGATWLSNGNPLDELLHIEAGKHYGFPPRHPKYLPDVRDEPPVAEYGPQHQSAVGMVFNESVNGGPHFGPAHWKGDALVCGESRGKIWRTKLAKTPLGYVAQNHLIACLTMLTVDTCVSPQGDLLIACHSGPPDWGTGPAGKGRVFKIRYTGRDLPQPVLAWAASPDEFRVAFDRALDPANWTNVQAKVEAGEFVSAGDRFEVLRPGYQVVRDQMSSPRRWVDVLDTDLSPDRRTLSIRVSRQTAAVTYAITLPIPGNWEQPGGIPQHPQLDVQATLNGLASTVTTSATLRTVLPHPSLDASALLTLGSAEHQAFLKAAAEKGATLTVSGSVDASNPFVPAVQPGAKLDWDIATDPVASETYSVRSDYGKEKQVSQASPEKWRHVEALATDAFPSANGLLLTRGDIRRRIPTERFRVPWAEVKSTTPTLDASTARSDVKGNWLRGRALFFGEATCFTCHTLRGEGMPFGPDLSNVIHRDRESVLQDILKPSATINPDQSGSVVQLKSGASFNGIVNKLDDNKAVILLPGGTQQEVPRADIAAIAPLKQSLMPEDFAQRLKPEQLEDLLTFLLISPLEPAPITRVDPPMPPARSIEEAQKILAAAPQPSVEKNTPLRILLVAGVKDHGTNEHDYPLWLERWSKLLRLADQVSVETASGFPTVEQLRATDVAVFYNGNRQWSPEAAAFLDEFHQRGGGAVYLHYAIDGGKDPDAVAERTGLAFALGGKYRHGPLDLVFPQPDHPITRGFPTVHFEDETYWSLRGDVSRLSVLGTVVEEGTPQPELWALQRHQSRIVGCIPGHYTWTFDDPLYRLLVLRSICWAAKQSDVDRLSALISIGARFRIGNR